MGINLVPLMPTYLRRAIRLLEDVIPYFWHSETGGFYHTGYYSEVVISRNQEIWSPSIRQFCDGLQFS
ncbi:MAG: hypothetical protein ABDH19_01545 [Thermodesulfovibrio sp.]